MGRASKLTDDQWEELQRRILSGETITALAKEFGVSKSTISEKVSERNRTIKTVANQLATAEISFEKLNISERSLTRSLTDDLKAISLSLAAAARNGASTAQRLSGLANCRAEELTAYSDMTPDGDGMAELKTIAALTKTANDSSVIAINLLNANKETVQKLNEVSQGNGDGISENPREAISAYQALIKG